MEQLLFLTACCTSTTVITLLPSIILRRETKTDFFSLFPLLPLLSTSPPCGIAILPVDPTAIHLGLPSPQSDNRLYLDALFWGTVVCVCVSMCAHVFIQRNSLSISMSPYATQAQWSPSQRALSCVCVLYWLSRRSMQHFYLWFISPGLQAHWVLFDWVLWPLGFKVGSRERQSIPVQVTWPSLREIVLSVYFCLQKKKQQGIASSPLSHIHTEPWINSLLCCIQQFKPPLRENSVGGMTAPHGINLKFLRWSWKKSQCCCPFIWSFALTHSLTYTFVLLHLWGTSPWSLVSNP